MSEERRSRLRRTRVLVWVVVAVAAGILAWALPKTIRFVPDAPAAFWAMALGALLVDIPLFGLSSKDDPRIRSTLSICFTFAIFVQWGAGPAIVVQTMAAAVSVIGQRYPLRPALFLVARLTCAVAAANLVVSIVDQRPVTRQGTGLNGGDLLAFLALAAVWAVVSYGLLTIARVALTKGPREAAAEARVDLIGTASAVLVVAPLLTTISGWWPLLIAGPLLVWNRLIRERIEYERLLGREPESGLLNRQALTGGVRAITAGDLITPAGPRPFGIILVNFESVTAINRTLGREIYEKVVGVASRRLIQAYGDRAARLSGEGVAILVPDLTEQDAIAATEAAVELLEPLVEVDDIPFALDPAGGVSLSPQHGRDLGTLLMKAELAASEARRHGERAHLYVRRAAELSERRITLLRELRNTLRDRDRHREITVLYQPQVELATGRLVSVEALLRWTHPQRGLIPTDELIEAVEPSEIMHLLTRHVLATVAAQMQRWLEQGDDYQVSVNVSVQDLHEPDFVEEVGQLVRNYGLASERLVIEITERMLITDRERVSQVANELAGQGVGLALDDFGTGYASLQQLRELPLTEVKVDRTYVRGMADNPADAAIVTSVHQLTRALGVRVVAEGVEDQRTADVLAKLPGTIGQGYHFGRPMSAEALEEWRRSR